jgi:LPS export ABC transporter protein LptC
MSNIMKISWELLVILLGLTLLTSCADPTVETTDITSEDHPDQESWDVTITMTDEGLKRVVVTAGHLEKYDERLFIYLDNNVEADFFDLEERHTTRLNSDRAEIDEKANYMRALKNVIVESDSGITLFTDTLSWDHDAELIYTDDSVMITTERNDTLYGIGFESDLLMDHWRILNPSGVTNRFND